MWSGGITIWRQGGSSCGRPGGRDSSRHLQHWHWTVEARQWRMHSNKAVFYELSFLAITHILQDLNFLTLKGCWEPATFHLRTRFWSLVEQPMMVFPTVTISTSTAPLRKPGSSEKKHCEVKRTTLGTFSSTGRPSIAKNGICSGLYIL